MQTRGQPMPNGQQVPPQGAFGPPQAGPAMPGPQPGGSTPDVHSMPHPPVMPMGQAPQPPPMMQGNMQPQGAFGPPPPQQPPPTPQGQHAARTMASNMGPNARR